MRLATYSDFYGDSYTHYYHHEGYAKRARLFEKFPEPILVVGCGFGFLVEEFDNLGKLAWGIDASSYAVQQSTHPRVRQFDILDLDGWTLGTFPTVITEDLWPNLTDSEVLVAARNCEALSEQFVINMVTESGESRKLNYHSTGYWISLTGQITISLEGT